MKCPKCENLYPSNYKQCINCGVDLVRERFVELEPKEEDKVSPFVESGEVKIDEI